MEIGKAGPKPSVKTEWEMNPSAPKPKEEPDVQKDIGQQLNDLAGVPTKKNYFQENKTLDKEAFLRMFLEQVKFQDPTKPADNEKVAQQMAMFSQLEQQMQTNKNLEKMISGQNNSQLMALNLMGKEVAVDHLTIQHQKNQQSPLSFKLPQEASQVRVKILNGEGEEVGVMDLGSRPEGTVEARWNGVHEDGRPIDSGRYFYAVEATDLKGQPISVESKITGKVTGISTGDGKTFVHVGDQKIDLMEIGLVKEPTIPLANSAIPNAADKNSAGTKSETLSGEVPSVPKTPEVAIDESVARAMRGEKPQVTDMEDMINPIMPIFSR
jgi:flagellar basal-body rod modification protein FlgD